MNSKKYILKHNFVNVEDNSINKIFLRNKKDIKLYVKQLLEINFYNIIIARCNKCYKYEELY